tara:strand:- start:882 stop:1112 length:231 start_codon:yes stop_codon:yes gene_type:complete
VNKDIDKLLESIISTTGKWYENVDKDTSDFLDAVENLVKQGKEVNSVTIADILEDEYNVKITAVSVRTWLKEVRKK